jgi:hypothetical protein
MERNEQFRDLGIEEFRNLRNQGYSKSGMRVKD